MTEKQKWINRIYKRVVVSSILITLIVGIFVTAPLLIFSTNLHTYLIKNATIEQVEQITQADPDGRVWYSSASLLAHGSGLLEVTFRTRHYEKHKIAEFLDSIGVECSELKVRNPR